MRMLQSILLATDLRPASFEAAEAAAHLALAFASRVNLLHVLEPLPSWLAGPHTQQELAAEPLRRLTEQLRARGVHVDEPVIVVGSPAEGIVRRAEELDVDLVVLAGGQVSGREGFSVGTTAEAVLERAPQPVLVVRPGHSTGGFTRILCPVDHSSVSRRGLDNAIRLARVLGARLVVLSVVPEVSWLTAATGTGQLKGARTEYESRWRSEFEQFLQGVPFGEVPCQREVRHGPVAQEIQTAAQEHEADLIVMGATGRTGLVRALLGSVTRRVLRNLPASLLVVKEEDVVEELFQGDVSTINNLLAGGQELLASGAHEAAQARFRQVLVRDRFNVAALEGLATACERLGQTEEAVFRRRRAAMIRQQTWA